MKIRIKGNSIRYRLTMSEVDALSRGNAIEETTVIGPNVFRYSLKPDPEINSLQARLEANTIILCMPESDALGWADDARIGFSNTVPLGGGARCLHSCWKRISPAWTKPGKTSPTTSPTPRQAADRLKPTSGRVHDQMSLIINTIAVFFHR